MSIASDTLQADLTLELRRDLAATRNALERANEAKASLERQNERLRKVCKAMGFKAHQMALEMEQLSREA